jgi:membrane protein
MLVWRILKTAAFEWFRHRSPRMGAALAYYSVFSMGPLLLLVAAIAGTFFGQDAVRGRLTEQFRSLLGPSGGRAVEAMLAGAAQPAASQVAAIVGIALLIVAAVGVMAQLKDAMNTIWNVEESKETSLWWYVRNYSISFAGIFVLGFLLTVSLVVSAVLSALSDWTGASADSAILQFVNFLVSLAFLSLLFAMLFKWFPDTPIAWTDVWLGAATTALLFNLGKQLIGWYVGTQGFESTYGAAASIVVLLIWIYYSAQIVLFGAELTHAYSAETGSRRNYRPSAATPHKE